MKNDPQNHVDPDKNKKLDFVFPDTLRDFDKLPLEFQGYCSYHLTVHDRLVIPSVPNIGVLHFKERYFGFLDSKAAEAFAANPDR